MAHHVHWAKEMGAWVPNCGNWYDFVPRMAPCWRSLGLQVSCSPSNAGQRRGAKCSNAAIPRKCSCRSSPAKHQTKWKRCCPESHAPYANSSTKPITTSLTQYAQPGNIGYRISIGTKPKNKPGAKVKPQKWRGPVIRYVFSLFLAKSPQIFRNFWPHSRLRVCFRKGKWRRKGDRESERLWVQGGDPVLYPPFSKPISNCE